MKDQAKELFKDALDKLSEAKEELCRPEEDLVSFVVCKNSQFAIENLLRSYLIDRSIDTIDLKTIDKLYSACLKLNGGFSTIDFSDFGCTSKEIDASYCDDASKVRNCYDKAEQLSNFLKEKIVL